LFKLGNNHTDLYSNLLTVVGGDPFWEQYLASVISKDHLPFSIHLAVTVEPFLRFMLEGRKTVESRFSSNRCAPYGRVEKGDVILLKRAGGPIVGICQVTNRWFYQLDPSSWQSIKEKFTKALCAESPNFWEEREGASYATLMRIYHVRRVKPIKFEKRDRRGWVVLSEALAQQQLRV
jgi:hypothetical protein